MFKMYIKYSLLIKALILYNCLDTISMVDPELMIMLH